MDEPLFAVENLRKTFGDYSRPVLDIARLIVPRGKIVAVLGESGSGKTTLFNVLGGLDYPDPSSGLKVELNLPSTGRFMLFNGNARDGSEDVYPRAHVSYIFQSGHLLKTADVRLNLALPRLASGLRAFKRDLLSWSEPFRVETQQADATGETTTIPIPLTTRAFQLSGGQQQRVGLARAIARDPLVIFADEPTSNLDPQLGRYVMSLFRKWIKDGEGTRSLLWVTHDYHLAAAIADDVFVLKGGRLTGDMAATGVPVPNPGSAEAIRTMVYGDAAEASTAQDMTFPTPRARRHAFARAATILEGARLGIQELFNPRPETGPLFLTRCRQRGLMAAILGAVVRAYRTFRYATLMFLIFAVLLLGSALHTMRGIVVNYFERQIANPKNSHVVVAGDNTEEQTLLSAKNIAELNGRPEWLARRTAHVGISSPGASGAGRHRLAALGSTHHTRSADGASSGSVSDARVTNDDDPCGQENGPFVYGRIAGARQRLSIVPAGGDEIDLLVMKASASEPVLREIAVKDLYGAPLSGDLASFFRNECLQDKPEVSVVLTERGLQELQRRIKFQADGPTARLWIWATTHPIRVKVLGVVERLPYDRGFEYLGIMDIGSYRSWLEQAGEGEIIKFERAAFYFDIDQFAELYEWLKEKHYEFDLEVFQKFSNLIGIARVFGWLFYLIAVIGAVVALVVIVASVSRYLRENQTAFAVLKAQGVGSLTLLSSVFVQLCVIVSVAIGHLYLLAALLDSINLAPTLFGSPVVARAMLPEAGPLLLILDFGFWRGVLIAAAVAIALILARAFWWLISMPKLADMLRQS